MGGDLTADYLAGLTAAQREELERVNGPGLKEQADSTGRDRSED